LIHHVDVVDGCGVAPAADPGAFVVTSGRGDVLQVEPRRDRRAPMAGLAPTVAAWDNHLIAVPRSTS
jgi:hypothetical protein